MLAESAPHVVVLRRSPSGFEVWVEPPLPNGDHRQTFWLKRDAWDAAQSLWTAHGLGLLDQTEGRSPL